MNNSATSSRISSFFIGQPGQPELPERIKLFEHNFLLSEKAPAEQVLEK
jgi:hypothetical protein